jgi:protein-S-isoprenylcysteine O-methyltransferase Ste14
MEIEKDSAQVRIPPPWALLAAVILGKLLQAFFPWHPIEGHWAGWILALGAFGLVIYCNVLFKRVGTNIAPWKASTSLMSAGVYGVSRNPIYSCFLLTCLGLALAWGNPWMLFCTLPLWAFLRFYVIAKEEAYLESKFGEPYLAYKARVRRWI